MNYIFALVLFFVAVNPTAPQPKGGIATLYALDPLAVSLCFTDGQPGKAFQAGEVRNRCSDLDFNSFNTNQFTVAVEGGRLGKIIDLGTPAQLQQKYGYRETTGGGGQGFASIALQGQTIKIKGRPDLQGKPKPPQDLEESKLLFQNGEPLAHLPIEVSHVYLIRLTDRNDPNFSLIAKLIVLAYRPNQTVTVRWEVL